MQSISLRIQHFVNSEPPVCGACGIVFDVLMGVKACDRIPILIAHATQCRPGIPLSLKEAMEKADYLTTELKKFRQHLAATEVRDEGKDTSAHLEGDEKAGKKRKNVTDGEERRLLLENDPWTKSVAKVEVTCKACNQRIQLDGRKGCAYYGYNWIKHKAICCKIPLDVREAVKAERAQRLTGKSRSKKSSKIKKRRSPSSSHAGHGSLKNAPSTSMSLRSSDHDQTQLDDVQHEEAPQKRRKVEGSRGPRETTPTETSLYATQSGIATRSRFITPSGTRSRYLDTVLCSPRHTPCLSPSPSPCIDDSFKSETSTSSRDEIVIKPSYFYSDSPTSTLRLRKATFE